MRRTSLTLGSSSWVRGTLAAAVGLGSAAAFADDSLRLGRQVVPVAESIHLVVDPDKPDYSGSVSITLDVKESVPSFRLHAKNMTLGKATLTRGTSAKESAPIPFESGDDGLVTFTAETPLAAGRCTLDIDFTNDFNTDATGLYRLQTEGHGYLFTQFEADDARDAFPCFDEPGFKVPWTMSLDVPADDVTIFNTPIQREARDGAVKHVFFKKTPPLPSYLLAIAVGPLETVDIPGLGFPGRIVTVQGQKELTGLAVESTPPILHAIEKWFGQKYPFEKLDLLAVPEYWAGAMENPGAITYSTNVLLLDPKAATVAQRRSQVRVTAHELAHMWFGDLVTMAWWDDLWLNESFADWLGDKITNEVRPEFRLDVSALSNIQGTMTGDTRPSSRAIEHDVKPGDNLMQDVGTAYNKGKAVLGMFESWVGPVAFQNGVRSYLRQHAWGNATADDLWAALSKTSGQDLAAAMRTFLEQPGLPLVTASIGADGKLELAQRRFLNAGVEAPALQWRIPVPVRWSDGKSTHKQTFLLTEPTQSFTLGEGSPAWVLPNADSYGYFRWSVSTENGSALIAHAQELTPRERIGLIGNSAALLDGGMLHGDQYLRTLAGFRDETDPIVMNRVVDSMGKIYNTFVTDDLREPFAAYVRRTLGPALERFGFDRKPGEDETVSLLRPDLIDWMGDRGNDTAVRAKAVEAAKLLLQDQASVDPAIAGVVLQLSALDGDRTLFDSYKQRFEAAKVPAVRSMYLSALGSFQDPQIVEAGLQYALDGPLRPQEVLRIPGGVASQSDHGRERVFQWLQANYDGIRKRMPEEFGSFLPFMVTGCNADRLQAVKDFFGDPQRAHAGTATALARVTDSTTDCVNLRTREGAGVAALLQEMVGTR